MNLIVFVIKKDPEREVAIPEGVQQACRTLTAAGVRTIAEPSEEFLPKMPDCVSEDALYLTDDPKVFAALEEAGAAVSGYAEDVADIDEALADVSYVVTQPEYVDIDDYEKVYERLKGLPWTILTTKRLVIREMTEEDMESMYACYDEEALRFLTPLPDRDTQRKNMASYREKVYGFFGFGEWSLILKETGEYVGQMGFEPYTRGVESISFGYLLHPKFRGQGLALEAGEAILRFAEAALGFKVVRAVTDSENVRSIRLLEKLGFQFLEDAVPLSENEADEMRGKKIYIRRSK